MSGWTKRYWGDENYAKLLSIKKKYDPNSVFACYHCIGDTVSSDEEDGMSPATIALIVTGSVLALALTVLVICYVKNKKKRIQNQLTERNSLL